MDECIIQCHGKHQQPCPGHPHDKRGTSSLFLSFSFSFIEEHYFFIWGSEMNESVAWGGSCCACGWCKYEWACLPLKVQSSRSSTRNMVARRLYWIWIIRHIVPWSTIRLGICGIYVFSSSIVDKGGSALVESSLLQRWLVNSFKLDSTKLLWGLRCCFHSQIVYK